MELETYVWLDEHTSNLIQSAFSTHTGSGVPLTERRGSVVTSLQYLA